MANGTQLLDATGRPYQLGYDAVDTSKKRRRPPRITQRSEDREEGVDQDDEDAEGGGQRHLAEQLAAARRADMAPQQAEQEGRGHHREDALHRPAEELHRGDGNA